MANTRAGNVILCDTTDSTFPDAVQICAIKYIGASTSSVTLKSGSSSGNKLWEESASTNVCDQVEIREKDGINVTVTGTAKVYLYLKV